MEIVQLVVQRIPTVDVDSRLQPTRLDQQIKVVRRKGSADAAAQDFFDELRQRPALAGRARFGFPQKLSV